ncbi:MAG: hypothetical protein MUF41_05170 [Sphingopyxis sp.]|nr:hypothetical protein [Sphingopyxis sp.]
MRILHTAIAAFLVTFAAAPAAASTGLNCIGDALTDAQRGEIVAAQQANVPVPDAFSTALGNCRAANQWNAAQAESAARYALNDILRGGLAAASRFSVDDIAAINAALASLPDDLMQRLSANPGNPNEADRMQILGAVIGSQVELAQSDIPFFGQYLSVYAPMRVAAAAFASPTP